MAKRSLSSSDLDIALAILHILRNADRPLSKKEIEDVLWDRGYIVYDPGEGIRRMKGTLPLHSSRY